MSLCYRFNLLQGGCARFCTMIHRAPLPMEFLFFLWHHCHLLCHRVSFMFGESLQNFDQHLFTSSCWSRLLSKGSVSVEMVNLGSALGKERSWHLFTPIPEQFKPVSHSTKLSRGAAWLRPPSLWTQARATRRYVSGGPGDVLPSHYPPSF